MNHFDQWVEPEAGGIWTQGAHRDPRNQTPRDPQGVEEAEFSQGKNGSGLSRDRDLCPSSTWPGSDQGWVQVGGSHLWEFKIDAFSEFPNWINFTIFSYCSFNPIGSIFNITALKHCTFNAASQIVRGLKEAKLYISLNESMCKLNTCHTATNYYDSWFFTCFWLVLLFHIYFKPNEIMLIN